MRNRLGEKKTFLKFFNKGESTLKFGLFFSPNISNLMILKKKNSGVIRERHRYFDGTYDSSNRIDWFSNGKFDVKCPMSFWHNWLTNERVSQWLEVVVWRWRGGIFNAATLEKSCAVIYHCYYIAKASNQWPIKLFLK